MTRIKRNNGFTLLELMTVVSIIGILAAIALPSYANFTKRAYVVDGLSAALSTKFAVYEYFFRYSAWPADNAAAEIDTQNQLTSQSVKSITINNGNIIITYNQRVVNDATLILAPSLSGGAITWNCSTGTVPASMRPHECHP